MGVPFAVTEPARISAFSRERDSSGRSTASTRSRRGDPSSPPTVTSSLCPPFDNPCSKLEPCMTDTVAPEPTPEQAALIARVRRMMLIAGLTSALAVAVVLIAVGYRLYRGEGSPTPSTKDITE